MKKMSVIADKMLRNAEAAPRRFFQAEATGVELDWTEVGHEAGSASRVRTRES